MEIERKWLVDGWPEEPLPLLVQHEMEQGYVVVRPTVRIRKEQKTGCSPRFILCIKTGSGLAREEIECEIPEEKYNEIRRVIGFPMILKTRRTYLLPDGNHLEVNHVDEGLDTEFWYAEIEYSDTGEAGSWLPGSCHMESYLISEVTEDPGQSMGAYWLRTRVHKNE